MRRFIVSVGSPRFQRLEELAAEIRQIPRQRMPPAYYAEQWRITAAQYYYERDLRQERAVADAGESNLRTHASENLPMLAATSPASDPVDFQTASAESTQPASYGSSYWLSEARRAKARQRTLLASMPAPVSVQRPTIVFGELVSGPRSTDWLPGAAAAAIFAALGMWWLQQATRPSAVAAECRPLMQLHLPRGWFRQTPPFAQRVVRNIVVVAWAGILAIFAVNLR